MPSFSYNPLITNTIMPRKNRIKDPEKSVKFHTMPVHAQDVLTDTQDFTDAEFGYYMRLLLTNWRNKGISPDPYRHLNMPGGGASMIDLMATTGGTTGNTTDGTASTTHSTTDGTYGGKYTGTNRLEMWEYIKNKFEPGENGMLVNPRVELERKKILDYYETQRINSLKGVEARNAKKGVQNKPENGTTTGSTNGKTAGRVHGLTQPEASNITSIEDNKDHTGNINNKGTTSGTTTGSTTEYSAEMPPGVRTYLLKSWPEFQKAGPSVTKDVSESDFGRWKAFVRFIETKRMHEVYRAKFVFPMDFAALLRMGFTEDRWELFLEKILSVGLAENQSMYWRLRDVFKWLKITPNIVPSTASSDPEISEKQKEFWKGILDKQRTSADNMLKNNRIDKDCYDFIIQNLKEGVELSDLLSKYNVQKSNRK